MKSVPIIGMCILLFLAACAQDQSNVIKIGVSLPQTGFAATMGEYIHHGTELALERMPEEKQKRIQLIFEDDQCNPTTGMTIARKLIEIDDTRFVLGPFCAAVITATMDYYDAQKAVRMITGLGVDTFVNTGSHRFILLGEVNDLMKPLAEHAYRNGLRRMGIIYLDDDYGKENEAYFEQWFEQVGGQIVAKESFVRNEQEFRTQLLKLKDKGIDGIFIAALGKHLVNILQEMDELEFKVPKYGLRNVEDPEIVRTAGTLLENVLFPSLTQPVTSELQEWFTRRYFEKYGKPPESVAVNAFDSFNILYAAIEHCEKDSDCIQAQITGIEEYEGASGHFSIDSRGVAVRDPVIRIVKNGKFELAD